MSSFSITAKNKTTGEISKVWCLDDYFGKREYGYLPDRGKENALREEQFYQQYDAVETP